MTTYNTIQNNLRFNKKTWLITGVAGFIGSNLLEALLNLDQRVVGLDNFATGHRKNLEDVKESVGAERWLRFSFVEGDVKNINDCRRGMNFLTEPRESTQSTTLTTESYPVDYVLHQAALGSVPRSLSDPISTNATNIDGFLNILVAARDAGVKSLIYAASSSTYGDHEALPKLEANIGKPLSPYAVTKLVNEIYAEVFSRNYGFKSIGLRYFNVFGKRQDPNGAYAAVIPKWIDAMMKGADVYINGDGETSRDFCYIDNVIQANILAATSDDVNKNEVYNVAAGGRVTLNMLYFKVAGILKENGFNVMDMPIYKDFRPGDVRHSQADINKARLKLGYEPSHDFSLGILAAVNWYLNKK